MATRTHMHVVSTGHMGTRRFQLPSLGPPACIAVCRLSVGASGGTGHTGKHSGKHSGCWQPVLSLSNHSTLTVMCDSHSCDGDIPALALSLCKQRMHFQTGLSMIPPGGQCQLFQNSPLVLPHKVRAPDAQGRLTL